MTQLAYAARNALVQLPSVTSLVGVDDLGDPMIYVNQPEATIENTSTSMIVLSTTDGWGANDHNDARFPVLIVDIWSDPTRNTDSSVRKKDADDKIEAVYKAVDKIFHLVNKSLPGGGSIFWGTASQVANGTALRIFASVRQNEPSLKPALNNDGSMMGTIRYNVSI